MVTRPSARQTMVSGGPSAEPTSHETEPTFLPSGRSGMTVHPLPPLGEQRGEGVALDVRGDPVQPPECAGDNARRLARVTQVVRHEEAPRPGNGVLLDPDGAAVPDGHDAKEVRPQPLPLRQGLHEGGALDGDDRVRHVPLVAPDRAPHACPEPATLAQHPIDVLLLGAEDALDGTVVARWDNVLDTAELEALLSELPVLDPA